MSIQTSLSASFRDPSGFVFRRDGMILRQVFPRYSHDYDSLMQSGLYDELTGDGLLISHEEAPIEWAFAPGAYRVLRPQMVPHISYPYEWSFGQLRDAALATLDVHTRALRRGMWLKDASAFNVQFLQGKPLLIDTLSFEVRPNGAPWIAYRQFCRHFLAPLALMAKVDVRLGRLSQLHLDGVPLDLASRMLPWRTKASPGLGIHIHAHARAERASASTKPAPQVQISNTALLALADSLRSTVSGLKLATARTEWANYYSDTNYTDTAMEAKRRIVGEYLDVAKPVSVWDLGANSGEFSRIAARAGADVVAWDLDPEAVEQHYRAIRETGEGGILPLVLDLANPSPGIGWNLEEREDLFSRGPADLTLALALVHHLAIGNNVPLPQVARFLARIANWSIVEFVPKEDSQVQRLLRSREDIFDDYCCKGFETALSGHFEIVRRSEVPESFRILYLLRRQP